MPKHPLETQLNNDSITNWFPIHLQHNSRLAFPKYKRKCILLVWCCHWRNYRISEHVRQSFNDFKAQKCFLHPILWILWKVKESLFLDSFPRLSPSVTPGNMGVCQSKLALSSHKGKGSMEPFFPYPKCTEILPLCLSPGVQGFEERNSRTDTVSSKENNITDFSVKMFTRYTRGEIVLIIMSLTLSCMKTHTNDSQVADWLNEWISGLDGKNVYRTETLNSSGNWWGAEEQPSVPKQQTERLPFNLWYSGGERQLDCKNDQETEIKDDKLDFINNMCAWVQIRLNI